MSGQIEVAPADSGIDQVVAPLARDLGGFTVERMLPSIKRRSVGPFVFLDQMGPVVLPPGMAADVRPHPHIGLATVTYLLEGEIMHRDSIGSVQRIVPGDVNWMTAGHGIAHSERSPIELRGEPQHVLGLQLWVALSRRDEETAPAFAHHPAESLPEIGGEGSLARLVVGSLFGARSPVAALSDTLLADVRLDPGGRIAIPATHEERAIQLIEGEVEIAGAGFRAPRLLVLQEGRQVVVAAPRASRFALLGGERLDGPRHIWWNFVSSSKERIEQAKADWRDGRFPPIAGETEFIPLPE